MKPIFLSIFLFISTISFGQGLVSGTFNPNDLPSPDGQLKILGCGSHEFIKHQDRIQKGYEKQADNLIEQISKIAQSSNRSSTSTGIITIPVVFHVVYNNAAENLPDSVILDQLRVLNESYRRTNADTSNTRAIFKDVVGDTKIEFKMATVDPQGKATTGITRTSTSIANFGGILPYTRTQTAQIQKWLADSLYYNLFRISQDSLGGKSEWDSKEYLNVWIGDIRIFEPKLGNFEEVFLLGLATNPKGHENWPDSVLPNYITANGTIIHYVGIGSNNPQNFDAPYSRFNSLAKAGKLLVHEVGHYLGLRHIWGDGDCSKDDYVKDTPLQLSNSQWGCQPARNTCTDPGTDLPDMIENYMDYSSGDCQNSFTKGQIDVMRDVYVRYRSKGPAASSLELNKSISFRTFPNPTTGDFNIELNDKLENIILVTILDAMGRTIYYHAFEPAENININLEAEAGIYFVKLNSGSQNATFKIIKE